MIIHQYGFREAYSTTTALVQVANHIAKKLIGRTPCGRTIVAYDIRFNRSQASFNVFVRFDQRIFQNITSVITRSEKICNQFLRPL